MSFGIEVKNSLGVVTFNSDSVGSFVLATISVTPTTSGTWVADKTGTNLDGYGLKIYPMEWQAPNVNDQPNFVSHLLTITYKNILGTSYTTPASDRYPKLVYAAANDVPAFEGSTVHNSTLYIFAEAI
jgi:hypothetical protein